MASVASRRSRGRALVAAAGALALVGVASPAGASATSGSVAAVRLYRQAASAMNHLPAYVINQHGYVRIDDSLGPKRLTRWAWGQDQFQPGEEAANERLVLVQRDGHVAWLDDVLRPVKTCAQGGICPRVFPLEFVITPSAAFVGIVSSGSTAACFTKEPLRDVPYEAGSSWWFAVGHYLPPVVVGSTTRLVARYANSGQEETETDWMRTATRRFTRSTFAVDAGSGFRAFSFGARYTPLAARPAAPKLTICS